jgi:hypothetical protein
MLIREEEVKRGEKISCIDRNLQFYATGLNQRENVLLRLSSNVKFCVHLLLETPRCFSSIQPDRRLLKIDNRKVAEPTPSATMMHLLIIRCMRLLIFQSHHPCAAQNEG